MGKELLVGRAALSVPMRQSMPHAGTRTKGGGQSGKGRRARHKVFGRCANVHVCDFRALYCGFARACYTTRNCVTSVVVCRNVYGCGERRGWSVLKFYYTKAGGGRGGARGGSISAALPFAIRPHLSRTLALSLRPRMTSRADGVISRRLTIRAEFRRSLALHVSVRGIHCTDYGQRKMLPTGASTPPGEDDLTVSVRHVPSLTIISCRQLYDHSTQVRPRSRCGMPSHRHGRCNSTHIHPIPHGHVFSHVGCTCQARSRTSTCGVHAPAHSFCQC